MFARLLGALARASMVIILIMVPVLLVPDPVSGNLPMMFVISVLSGLFVGAEYFSAYPSLISFRMAGPFNRWRYMVALAVVTVISLQNSQLFLSTALGEFVTSLAMLSARWFVWAAAPMSEAILSAEGFDPLLHDYVYQACSLAFSFGIFLMAIFTFTVLHCEWPKNAKPFNIWLNLPLLDPKWADQISRHLRRLSLIYLLLGLLMPFVIPEVLKIFSRIWSAKAVVEPHSFIWIVSLWVLTPMFLIMRSIGLYRVCRFLDKAEKAKEAAFLAPLSNMRSKV